MYVTRKVHVASAPLPCLKEREKTVTEYHQIFARKTEKQEGGLEKDAIKVQW